MNNNNDNNKTEIETYIYAKDTMKEIIKILDGLEVAKGIDNSRKIVTIYEILNRPLEEGKTTIKEK